VVGEEGQVVEKRWGRKEKSEKDGWGQGENSDPTKRLSVRKRDRGNGKSHD